MHITTEQRDWLRAESQRTGTPINEIVRRAIDAARIGRAVMQDRS